MAKREESIRKIEERAKTLRRHIVTMLGEARSGHPGGSLSIADLVATLYFEIMNHDSQNPQWEKRDRLVLSKGHAAPAVYAALAEAGYFPVKELMGLRKVGQMLQGHPDMKNTPGIEASTGSLGQGLSMANGMALAAQLDQRSSRIYVILGDGELQEGQVWEAAMTSAHRKLDNLMAFVDYNGLQIDGKVTDVKSLDRIGERFASFGWHVLEIDGHNVGAILQADETARQTKGRPTVAVCRTIKGKGVSFMENLGNWHGVAPNAEQVQTALGELEI